MLGHGVRIWLAILGLLGSLLVAPAPALADCCPSGAEAAVAADCPDTCCPSTDRDPPRPAEDGRCKCPRPCCIAPPPVATVRLITPDVWAEPLVGLALPAIAGVRSAEFHLKLVRPPRA